MTLRPIQPEGYDTWRLFWAACLEFYQTSVEDNIYKLRLNRLISSEQPKQCDFGAELDGALLGSDHYILRPRNWKSKKAVYLEDLFPKNDQRGKGTDRAFIQAVYRIADINATSTVYWRTQETKIMVRWLYDNIVTLTTFIRHTR